MANCNRCGATLEGIGPRCNLCHQKDLQASSPAVLLPAGVELSEVFLDPLPGAPYPNPLKPEAAVKGGWILMTKEGNREAVYSLSRRVRLSLRLTPPSEPKPAPGRAVPVYSKGR